jgi:hypothetical protein
MEETMKTKKYLPLRLPPRLQTYSFIVRTPTLEKTVRLNETETALIYSRPPLCGHDRFFYTVERMTETGFTCSGSYDGFYSVEEAEADAQYFTGISLKPQPQQPASFHRHTCYNCAGTSDHECVSPECAPSYYTRLPVVCPRYGSLTLLPYPRRRKGRPYKGQVSTLIPPAKAEAVAAV